jgi:hypothetical protein
MIRQAAADAIQARREARLTRCGFARVGGTGALRAAWAGYWARSLPMRLDNPARGVMRPADVGGRAMMNTRCSAVADLSRFR